MRGRPKRFPNGLKAMSIQLPPEVIEAFQERGGREWLMKELGFDYGPKPKTYTAKAKQDKDTSRKGWAALKSVFS